jgi:alkanesulfonate monooxygenase SsuD/methylene tetrahydromethanopterin reductase-like flavin-dependent oxidoreductase (luciferase family)
MEFGLFSNGHRPHTTAAQTYDEDLFEIVTADELGFRYAWISEHHAEPIYKNRVDTNPVPELLMCKAAALTRQIRMGPAVKVIHLTHPVDVAIHAAVTDHVTNGRYIFGFGSGFANAFFSEERGLSFEDRHERMMESLDLILKCWQSEEPFDWDGVHWRGKGIFTEPKPLQQPLPIAVASLTPETVRVAGERGYTLLTTSAAGIRRLADAYASGALLAGRPRPLENVAVAHAVHIADSFEEALDDLRPAVTQEMNFQKTRGLMGLIVRGLGLQKSPEEITFDDLVAAGAYILGDAHQVKEQLLRLYEESGGFGKLLLIAGKNWGTREHRARSYRRFIEQVAPYLADLVPDWHPSAAAV